MPKKSSGMQKFIFLNRISPQKMNKPKIPFYFTVIVGVSKYVLQYVLANEESGKIAFRELKLQGPSTLYTANSN